MMKRMGVLFLLGVFICMAPAAVTAVEFQVPGTNTSLNVGGYVKLDIIYNDVSNGDNSQDNVEFSPNGVPLDGDTDGEEDQLVFNGRESRLWVKTATPTDLGPLKSHLEFDFATNEGNQLVSNSHYSRIRHAYFTLNNWLMGRTWSLFMHLDSLPEINDFGGPTGSMFVRQAQIRYTMPLDDISSLAIGLENPETYFVDTPTPGPASTDDIAAADDGIFPDVIVRYNMNPNWGNLSGAVMVRSLVVEEPAPGVDDSTFAISGQFGAVFKIGANDSVRGAVQLGEALGRYSSLGSHPDAVISGGNVEAVQQLAGFAGYEHIWGGANNWRSNLILGFSKADDPAELIGTNLTEETFSVHANLFMDPVPGARLGIEYILGSRETYGGDEGELNRLQFSAMYVF